MPAQFSLPDIVRPSLALRDSWDGESAATFGCRFHDLHELLPTFSRQPFTVNPAVGRGFSPAVGPYVGRDFSPAVARPFRAADIPANPHLDVIVRNPDDFLPVPVPVATVSTRYALVQHRDAMDAVAHALARRKIPPDDLPVDVTTSEFGSRLACSVRLPDTFDFAETDGTRMALTIECFNSVDGSTAFRVLAGWFRFICSNGLIIGNTKLDFRRAHRPSLELGRVEWALERGLRAADLERKRFERWQEREVPWPQVTQWADRTVAEEWGVLAAARLLHIARTGHDARFATARWRGPLSQRPMVPGASVPGSAPPANTVYKVSQILAWLAGQTREVAARIERRSQVVPLVRPLARA